MYIFITLLATIIYLMHIYTKIKNKRIIKMLENVPQVKRLPFIGTAYRYFKKNYFVALQEIVNEVGLPNITWVGTRANYMTKDPNEIKIILNHYLEKSNNLKFLQFAFGDSLLLAPVDLWKKNRKILSKAFNQNILDGYVPIFNDKSQVLLDILKKKEESDVMYDIFQNFAMDSFLQTTIGVDYKLQQKQNTKYVELISKMANIAMERLCNPLMYSDFMFYYFGDGTTLNKAIKETKQFILDIITRKRQEPHVIPNKKTLIDIILNLNEKEEFSDEHIIHEILLFWSAASDTTGAALAFACTLLGMNPDIQQKLHEEIVNNIEVDKPIEYSDLLNLKYTEMVINETLRIVPVIPILSRLATEDIDLGSRIIPKGVEILLSVFNLHHDKQFYKEPNKFSPERFTAEEILKRPQYSFIPFSGGLRNCIGWKYSMMLMKTALVNIVQNFEISSKHKSFEDFQLEADIVIRTKNHLNCTFKLRK